MALLVSYGALCWLRTSLFGKQTVGMEWSMDEVQAQIQVQPGFHKVSNKQTLQYGDMLQSILIPALYPLDNMHLVQGFPLKLLNKHILIFVNVGWMDSHKVDQDPRGFPEPAPLKVKKQLQHPCRRDKVIIGLSFKLWIKLLLFRVSGMAMKRSIKINGDERSHLEILENGEFICFCGSYSYHLDALYHPVLIKESILDLELNKDERHDLLNEKVKMFENEDGIVYLSNLKLMNVLKEEAFNHLFIGDLNRMNCGTSNNDTSSMLGSIMIVSESQKIGSNKVHRTINLANATERIYESGLNGKILKESKYINLSKDHRLCIIPHDHDTIINKYYGNGYQEIYGTDKERYRNDTKLNIKTMKSNNEVFCRQYGIKHKGIKSIEPILSIVLWVYCRSLNTCTGLRQTVKTKDINIREHLNWSTYLMQRVQCFGDSYYQLTPTELNDNRYYIADIIVKYSITTVTTPQLPDITLNTAQIITFKRHCDNTLSQECDDLYFVKYLSRSKRFESNNDRAESGLYVEDINDIENKDEVLSDKETSTLSDVCKKHLMNKKIPNVNIDEDDKERVSTDNTSSIPNNNTLNDDENTLYIDCSFKSLSVLNEILDLSSDIMHHVLYYSLQELGQCLSDLTGFIHGDYGHALTLRLFKVVLVLEIQQMVQNMIQNNHHQNDEKACLLNKGT